MLTVLFIITRHISETRLTQYHLGKDDKDLVNLSSCTRLAEAI